MADPYAGQAPPPAYQQQPAGAYPPPQPGAYQQPPPGVYGQQSTVVVQQPQQVVVTGGCPACGIGHISENFTALGICLAICFFPLGVLCCFLMMEKRCSHCGASF